MTDTLDRGPFVNAGSLLDNRIEPFDGPSIDYQANVIPDVRFGPIKKDSAQPAQVPTFLNSPYVVMTDNVLSASSTTTLAAAQVVTSGVAMTLNTTSVGGSAAGTPSYTFGVPLIPVGTTIATSVAVIDFGFATGTTTASSSTVVVKDSTQFSQGSWYVIGGAGNAANTTSIIVQVATVLNATTMNVTPSPAGSLTNAPIGDANLYGSGLLPPTGQLGSPPTPAATAVNPYTAGGMAAIFNPLETVARNLSVTASASTGGTAAILVTGYDIYGNLMTELLTATGTTTAYGHKAFKYVLNAVAQTTQGANYTLGIGDVVGFHIRIDKWEYSNIFWNGSFAVNNNGWTQATTVSPSTNITGDVRGTVQLSTNGPLGTSVGGSAVSNGTTRLTLMMSVPLYNLINATPLNAVPMFGVPQSTT